MRIGRRRSQDANRAKGAREGNFDPNAKMDPLAPITDKGPQASLTRDGGSRGRAQMEAARAAAIQGSATVAAGQAAQKPGALQQAGSVLPGAGGARKDGDLPVTETSKSSKAGAVNRTTGVRAVLQSGYPPTVERAKRLVRPLGRSRTLSASLDEVLSNSEPPNYSQIVNLVDTLSEREDENHEQRKEAIEVLIEELRLRAFVSAKRLGLTEE